MSFLTTGLLIFTGTLLGYGFGKFVHRDKSKELYRYENDVLREQLNDAQTELMYSRSGKSMKQTTSHNVTKLRS